MTKKTIKHASADVGLIFCDYNLRRIFNLIDHNLLKQYLKVLTLYFGSLGAIFKAFYTLFSFEKVKFASFKKNNRSLNHIYLLTDYLNGVRAEVFR